jgi:hypothetical protein
MIEFVYDVRLFVWSKENNAFYGDAWELETHSNGYKEAFPSNRSKFTIVNHRTKGFRVFKLHKETSDHYLFLSEDGIRCVICINPLYYDKQVPTYTA